ncbi:hypothetical protein OE88DRAFT_1811779 [Heliocybe sulcata]|uniref:Fungal-type protein kinase domain-containing protein n=1 Tax=Heliocybe sulcata TaxID=5364 RepID=A0A5C3MMP1_9AGAM|nr:hypothetical protein OE88DRAFT_1811779 [Heliocybe sulcata]
MSDSRAPSYPRNTYDTAWTEAKPDYARLLMSQIIQLFLYACNPVAQRPSGKAIWGIGVVLTEKYIRLYQRDSVGPTFSCGTDIHANVWTFVKIILALSTVREKLLGFQTRIYWDTPVRHSKPDLTNPEVYSIDKMDRTLRTHTIRGRGTTSWILDGEDGSKLLLKLAWHTIERDAERIFLHRILKENSKCAKQGRTHISGVGSAVEPQGDLEKLSDLRRCVPDRIHDCISQVYYGPTLEKAAPFLQPLDALHDAIGRQAKLHELALAVHRDISIHSMLVSPSFDVVEALRGHLIHSDMAERIDKDQSTAGKDLCAGTRVFQSIKVLEELGVHDYLDDLEATFWAYAWIACTRGSSSLGLTINAKEDFLRCEYSQRLVSPGMGPHVKWLIGCFARFFYWISFPRVEALRRQRNEGGRRDQDMLDSIKRTLRKYGLQREHATSPSQFDAADVNNHFSIVLAIVETAIEKEMTDVDRKAAGTFQRMSDHDHETPVLVTRFHGPMNQQSPI